MVLSEPQEGKVIAVGPGKWDENGKRIPLQVKKGDRVLFGKYTGNEIKIDEVEHLIMREDDILGIIEKSWGSPKISKDGVTVAKEIELEDRFENMGAQMVKEVASKTSDVAGDGTTTATLLAQAIYREGSKLVAAGSNPMAIKRGIEKGVEAVVKELKNISKPTKDHKEIAQVGTISANNDETIGNIIAEAMEKVGKEGVITVEEAKSMETTLEVVEGMQFDRGYLSPYFVTNAERMETGLEEGN